jgi:hypothetical protein
MESPEIKQSAIQFQVDEELAMTTEKVTRTLVSGKCGIFVMPAVAI